MKTDVLFVTNPLSLISYVHQKDLYTGYRYMASVLRSRGFGAEILYPELPREFPETVYFCDDARIASRRLRTELLNCISEQIAGVDCRVLGFSPNISNFRFIIALVRKLRSSGCDSHVVLGGHLATFSHKRLLSHYDCIDSIVRGEGEYTIVELTERIKRGETLEGVLGLSYRNGNATTVNPPRPLVPDLNDLPLPATDRLDELAHDPEGRSYWMRICCSRGCYGNCSFCSVRAFYHLCPGKKWRARSPRKVVDELEMLKRDFGMDSFVLGGDNFWCGTEKQRVAYTNEVAQEIIRRKLDVRLKINCRSNDVHENNLKQMKRAGLTDVEIGVESVSQRALDTFRKGTSVRQNEAALRLLKKLGLRVYIDFIFYDPYLNLNEVRQNFEFQRRYWAENVGFPLFTKLILAEGFPITETLRQEGLLEGRFPLYEFRFADPIVGSLESVHTKTWIKGHHILSTLPPLMAASFYGVALSDERSRELKPFLSALKNRFEFLKLHYFDRMLQAIESTKARNADSVERLLAREVAPWNDEIDETRNSLRSIYLHLRECVPAGEE